MRECRYARHASGLIEDRELELTVPPKLRHVEEEACVALRKL
jgi:hypothetical protein